MPAVVNARNTVLIPKNIAVSLQATIMGLALFLNEVPFCIE